VKALPQTKSVGFLDNSAWCAARRSAKFERDWHLTADEEMDEHNIRATIDRHWVASAAGDQVGEHEIYHDDVVCEYPQSGEIIYGRQSLQTLRSHHPDKPSEFTVRRIVGEGNLWVSEYVINYGGKRLFTVSVMEFRDGRVSHETQYFADSFDAPAWRAQWVGRSP
jgi:ketosteroid isomerase-like protein